MASSKETYCLCGQPYKIGQFMIECDCCREWFHGSCVNVKIYQSDDIDKYHCPKCSQTYGPSVLKIPTNNHRADRYEMGAECRPSQAGSPAWVRALAARPLRPSAQALRTMQPHHFTEEFIRDDGFNQPVIFHTPDGLDLKTPNPATFTVRSVLRFCGSQMEIDVIDVRKQATMRTTLGDFVDYFETPPEHRDEKVLNVLSLEFSDTGLSPLVEPPSVARQLDWAETVWGGPEARKPARPAVRKYCLISAAGAYTDFHVDFGGTTVWYHVLHGLKIFYLIPPTSTNLALYQQWCAANNQSERFFGDMVEWYGTCELRAGETLFIPAGWIHGVLTPCDSLVFGGNFLHSYAIEMQLQIYEIERRVETPQMLRYPLFEAMHWFAGAHLLSVLRRHNEDAQDEEFHPEEGGGAKGCAPPPPALLLRGIKILANALREWHALKATDATKRDNVPKCLNSGQLVRELNKELRNLEKRSSYREKETKHKVHTAPNKPHSKKHHSSSSKKPLKLTLPKPIMHMGENGNFIEEKVYADRYFIDNKEVTFQEQRYEDSKYNGLQDGKYIVDDKNAVLPDKGYQFQYDDQVQDYNVNGYLERQDKKHILKMKLNISPSSSRDDAPPPYSLPEHSILKSHLIRTERPTLKPIHQWTISKKDIGDYHEEQILFTNENLQPNTRIENPEISYGAGMYSAEDLHQAYDYEESKQTAGVPYQDYAYTEPHGAGGVAYPAEAYRGYPPDAHAPAHPAVLQSASFGEMSTAEQMNGGYHPNALPSYDAAIAQHYATDSYQQQAVPAEDAKNPYSAPPPAAPAAGSTPGVRRSERAARRRVSNTYEYEDGDLYVDETPVHRGRHRQRHSGGGGAYRSEAGSACAPANGIESLIQASVLAEEEPADDTEDAAVAGMLSISERCTPAHRAFGLAAQRSSRRSPANASRRAKKPPVVVSSADEDLDDEEDIIKEVHRDEEYVYPSLEMSSDDDEEWSSPRRRRTQRTRLDSRTREKDEAWSPRARLGRLLPRVRGPARAGVRRECVRAALTAAAATPRHAPPTHLAHDAAHPNAKRAVLAMKSRRPPPPAPPVVINKNARLKKGMKTAKQRLGKILKLHKMMY